MPAREYKDFEKLDLRVAEVTKLDMKVENGKVAAFRARVNLSFKYGGGE